MPVPGDIEKLARPPIREEVYVALREWIVDGTLHPGEQVRDYELAVALGVSRTPIREAFRRLEDEGLVQTATNRWTRVAPVNVRDAHDIYPIMWALESLALMRSRIPSGEPERAAMAAANARIRAALLNGSPVEAAAADEHFHSILLSETGNDEIIRIVRNLRVKLRRVAIAYFDGNIVAEQSAVEHDAILNALRMETPAQAAQAVESHWQRSYQRSLEHLRQTAPQVHAAADTHPRGDRTRPRPFSASHRA